MLMQYSRAQKTFPVWFETKRMATESEQYFRSKRKLNETKWNQMGNVFLSPIVYCIAFMVILSSLFMQDLKITPLINAKAPPTN